jgi:hypothetical protein
VADLPLSVWRYIISFATWSLYFVTTPENKNEYGSNLVNNWFKSRNNSINSSQQVTYPFYSDQLNLLNSWSQSISPAVHPNFVSETPGRYGKASP